MQKEISPNCEQETHFACPTVFDYKNSETVSCSCDCHKKEKRAFTVHAQITQQLVTTIYATSLDEAYDLADEHLTSSIDFHHGAPKFSLGIITENDRTVPTYEEFYQALMGGK